MISFETRTARGGMTPVEIKKFVGDFTEALVRLALSRIQDDDVETGEFGSRFDRSAGPLDWTNATLLASAGIDIAWLIGTRLPHRIFMHPDFVTREPKWTSVIDYIAISMVSEKASKVLFPNLVKRRRPIDISDQDLLEEAKILNRYLHLVQSFGCSSDRIMTYRGDLRTHGQGQNDSGRIGAVGATVAILDALAEISPGAVVSTFGTMPLRTSKTPGDVVRQMSVANYTAPKALLLSSQRAIIFSADPDVAIISRIGGGRPYASAKEASEEWAELKRLTASERTSTMRQAALGEVKTALDQANMHERLALGARENRDEAMAIRFLIMAILTPDILDPDRVGRRAMFNRDAQRFQEVFNLYFVWGYDGARHAHSEHWSHFKQALKNWTGL